MTDWYAVRTATRQERVVAAGLAERGFSIFLPMETDWRGSPRVRHMEPLLPGYVFVLCDPRNFADVHGIEGVTGFVRYMGNDGVLWPVPFPGMDVLRFQMDERDGAFDRTRNVKPPRYQPKKGERVQITAGTYLGFFAKVLSAPDKDRRKLLIEGFEKQRHKTLDIAHLVAA
jgi:transcriptional antiterminator RfaH